MASSTIGIKVDEAMRQRLKAIAEAKQRTPHWIAKEALAQYLAREEVKEEQRQQDDQRWQRYLMTGEAVAHEDVRDWLSALAEGKDTKCPT